jgi:hypothetical protein
MRNLKSKTNSEKEVIKAEAKICENAGIPNKKGTSRWSDISKDIDGNYCIANPVNGWSGVTEEQMMEGVVNMVAYDAVFPEIEEEGE